MGIVGLIGLFGGFLWKVIDWLIYFFFFWIVWMNGEGNIWENIYGVLGILEKGFVLFLPPFFFDWKELKGI